ncbi:TolB family protein [Candidatus Poribacteria bacterium]
MLEKSKLSVTSLDFYRRILDLLTLSILLLAFAHGWAQAADGPEGVLVVESLLMEPDGSIIRSLAGFSVNSAAWSPDSQHIALAGSDVFVVKYDGSDLTNLTNQGARCSGVSWSPDGSRLAFLSEMTGDWDVYVIDSDGQGLTNLSNHPAKDVNPTWSPDGQRLAFGSKRDGQMDIYLVDADGGNLKNLTNHPASDRSSAWSPTDSSQLAFISDRNGDDALYLIDPDEQDTALLYQAPPRPDYGGPVWSPDGSQILLLLDVAMTHTYVIDVASGAARKITGWFVDNSLCWSPDGQYIAFARVFFGPGPEDVKRNITGTYIMRSNGGGLTRISPTRAFVLDWGMPPSSHSIDTLHRLPTLWGQIKSEAQ